MRFAEIVTRQPQQVHHLTYTFKAIYGSRGQVSKKFVVIKFLELLSTVKYSLRSACDFPF